MAKVDVFVTTRRLSAILAADVVGFSTLMEANGEAALQRIKALERDTIQPRLEAHGGRLFKTMGDGFLAEFISVVNAVYCAIEIQDASNAMGLTEEPLRLRIGVHLGDVFVQEDGDLYGDGVNVAARLEQIAETGGVCISGSVYDQLERNLSMRFNDCGTQILKNINRSIKIYSTSGLRGTISSPSYLADHPSIAIIPFANLSSDIEVDYFVDGVVEEIITALLHFKWLSVIGRNSVFTYKGRSLDSRQVGRELGVRYIVEGSIRKSGARVRISSQLIEATTGRSMWGQKFDGSIEDIFSFQDQITESIVGTIEPNIRKAEIERARRKPTHKLDAYDFYLRGLEKFYKSSKLGIEGAREFLREAINRDENFSEAWAVLASCAARSVLDGWAENVDEAIAESCHAASRAVALDAGNGLVIAWASWVLAIICGRLEQAAKLAHLAVELVPNSATALGFTAWVLIWNGEFETALAALTKAERLDPVDPRRDYMMGAVALAYFFQRRFQDSIAITERLAVELPTYKPARRFLAAAYAQKGDLVRAKNIVEELLVEQPSMSIRNIQKVCHFKFDWMMALYIEGLRSAGVPD